jgi:hypothetical protein
MKKSMSLMLMGILLGGSAMVMAQTVPTVPEVDQTGENEGAYGTDTAEPAGAPEPTDTLSEPVETPDARG